jgi:acyl carrier protein
VLTDKPTPAQIEEIVHRTIADLLKRNGKSLDVLDNDRPLVAVGLTSLDLAALISMLERKLKADPFLEAIAITDMRTVGDLCRAYRDFIGRG